MHISLLSAQDALQQLLSSWLSLQSRCAQGDNSNNHLYLADHLQTEPESKLLILCVHDGEPSQELHGLCVLEQQRHWIANRHSLANWIYKPGLHSAPLLSDEQRFSALDTILRELPTHHPSTILNLRHLKPDGDTVTALKAICEQRQLALQASDERGGSLCELELSLHSTKTKPSPPLLTHQFNSLRSLP